MYGLCNNMLAYCAMCRGGYAPFVIDITPQIESISSVTDHELLVDVYDPSELGNEGNLLGKQRAEVRNHAYNPPFLVAGGLQSTQQTVQIDCYFAESYLPSSGAEHALAHCLMCHHVQGMPCMTA